MSVCFLPSKYNLQLVVLTEANSCFWHWFQSLISFLLISQFNVHASAVWTVKALISLVATSGIQASSTDWRTQTRSLIPLWDLRSPHCPSHIPSQLQQPLQAGRPPSSHQLQPIPCSAGSCLCDPEGLTESWRSEVALHTATNGTSQKSMYQKPCGDTPTWPLDSEGEAGIRPLLNNGLFSHSNLVGCLFYCNYFEFSFMFLTSFLIRITKLYILSLVAVVQALTAVVGSALMPWTKLNLWPL